MAHEVLDSVYGEPDVSTVLDARGDEQLNEVKRSLHQLVLVCRIRGDRPVSVGPAQRHAAEGSGVVDDRPDIDLGRSQLYVDRVRGVRGPSTLARIVLSPRLLAVNVVVTGNDHIVEVDVDSNPFAHGASLRPAGKGPLGSGHEDSGIPGRCRARRLNSVDSADAPSGLKRRASSSTSPVDPTVPGSRTARGSPVPWRETEPPRGEELNVCLARSVHREREPASFEQSSTCRRAPDRSSGTPASHD
jgi:hypothetical protein